MFKNISWFFALALGALMFYTAAQIPREGDSPLALHLSARYLKKSAVETGISSPVGAAAGDYRGFDLLAVGFFFSLSALLIFLGTRGASRSVVFFPAVLWMGGALLAEGLGFFTLYHGSNFLDYEALAACGPAAQARLSGVLFLTAGALLSFAGLVLAAIQSAKVPEVPGER